AGQRERDFVAHFIIGRATNDLPFCTAAIIDFANSQTVGVWMTRRLLDLRDNDIVDLCATLLDIFGFSAGASQRIGDVFGIFWKIGDEFAKPVNGKFHANWRRNRKSFCAKRRRSGMSNKIIARRSMPSPNAKPLHFSGS